MPKINYTSEDLASHDALAAVIMDDGGRILMQEHVKFGFWTIPLGKAKPAQTVSDALKEELFVECNIAVKDFKLLKLKKFQYSRNNKGIIVNGHLFEIIAYSGIIKNKEPNKHKTQTFLDLDTIKKLPYLSDLTLLYLEYLGFKRKARI